MKMIEDAQIIEDQTIDTPVYPIEDQMIEDQMIDTPVYPPIEDQMIEDAQMIDTPVYPIDAQMIEDQMIEDAKTIDANAVLRDLLLLVSQNFLLPLLVPCLLLLLCHCLSLLRFKSLMNPALRPPRQPT